VRVHSDGGKEYEKLERLEDHLAAYYAPYTPENNPISERGNRTLFDAARTLPIEADLPACFWPFAIKHVVYVRNLVRHATTGDCPYYMVTGEKPSLKNLKVFGCRAYILILPTPQNLSVVLNLVSYWSVFYMAYTKFLSLRRMEESQKITSRHVTFDDTQNDSKTDIKITTSHSPTLREAISSTPIEPELWQQSIAEEMESLQAIGTWVDVDVATCPPLPAHPVLQIKRTVNGEFERCKTRIVAGGDHQEYGVNYTDTYAPVIEWTIARLFLYLSRVRTPIMERLCYHI
jgi:hypothetical protein